MRRRAFFRLLLTRQMLARLSLSCVRVTFSSRIEGRTIVHHLAPSAILVVSLLVHTRAICLWVRDRSRQRLNCAVLRELARTGGTVREEHRSRSGSVLVWELQLPDNRGDVGRAPHAHGRIPASRPPRLRRCAAGPGTSSRAAPRPSAVGDAGFVGEAGGGR